MRLKKISIVVIGCLLMLVAVTNGAYWLAERYDDNPAGVGTCAVLVLGSPTRADGTSGPIQHFRVDAGVRAFRKQACSALVLSGGAAHNRYVEAQAMAKLAEAEGVAPGHIVVEGRSRSTWENIGCSTPLVAGYGRVLIVSDSLHAFRAKRYACRQDTDLCRRVRAVGKMGPANLWWWRIPGAIYELRDYLRDKLIYERHPARNSAVCPVGSKSGVQQTG